MADNENIDKWYVTRKELEENSPSRRDGISLKKENQLREKCIHFIVENGKKFRIHQSVIATANVCCHRFFLQQSHAKYEWYRIAIACLFLASKVEEHRIWMDDFKEEGWRETLEEVFKKQVPFEQLKDMIIGDEREILEAINFEFSVDQPYKYFFKAVCKIKDVPAEVCQAATEFMNDSYYSTLCLQVKPHKIARAAFHLSHKFLKFKLPFQEQEGYREFFQMTPNELEDISRQMLDLYEYTLPQHTAPDNESASSSSLSDNQSASSSSLSDNQSASSSSLSDNQSASTSSLSDNQSFSPSASMAAPPPQPAAHGNQVPQPPDAPSNKSASAHSRGT